MLRFLRKSSLTAYPKSVPLSRGQALHFQGIRCLSSTALPETTSTPPPEKAPPSTFSNQHLLPRLPIPPLQQSLSRYLRSLRPLLSDAQFQHSQKVVDEFLASNGIGEVLQKRLLALDKAQPFSWLEQIWIDKAYLEYRQPLLVNVNWWVCLKNHPQHPNQLLRIPPPKGTFTDFQIHRAAGMISNLLNFKQALDNENVPPNYSKKSPLCMNQYKGVFGVARIPDTDRDRMHMPYPSKARHIVVMARDQLYRVDVLGHNGQRVKIDDIKRQLQHIANSVKVKQPAVGLLTSEHRDVWANLYKKMEKSQLNRRSLNAINESLFVVCLDDHSSSKEDDVFHHQIFHNFDARNRWFDKSIQLIVANNGRIGVNGEHTPVDAVVPGSIFEYCVANEPAQDPIDARPITLPIPTPLEWDITEDMHMAINHAEVNAKKLNSGIRSVLLQHVDFGSDWVKKKAKTSPDAFMQMLLHLSYHRTHGDVCATYESASTRQFLHGRTDTIRSCTSASKAFCEAMANKNLMLQQKRHQFGLAAQTHIENTKQVINGEGCDRHLLGLRCMVENEDEFNSIGLFKDPAFAKSMHYKMSTSNVSPGLSYFGGFAAVVSDGYGVNYSVSDTGMNFSISSWNLTGVGADASAFREALKESMNDMHELFDGQ